MDGLIELIFDGVPDDALDGLVWDLLHGAEVLGISHSELGNLDQRQVAQYLMPFLKKEVVPTSIFIRAVCATVGSVVIHRPLVRILRFEGANEVAVIFDRISIEVTDHQDVVTKLATGASVLANSAKVSRYYCGFEPATDAKTRLFFKDKIGPLTGI